MYSTQLSINTKLGGLANQNDKQCKRWKGVSQIAVD